MRAKALLFAFTFGCAIVPALAQPASTAVAPPPGATTCSGCHAARAGIATAVPTIHGRNAEEIVFAMQAYRSGQRPATVMDRLARGFSDDEIRAIAVWLSDER